ncbi:hypothetical protein [Leptospira noguchii]|uniref:hypothetical protein n=1 Tax=Leptospira noguchii TaxID=28182 RepID=UPI00031A6822|nr:hypothetical protein [Leptospira noguchii]
MKHSLWVVFQNLKLSCEIVLSFRKKRKTRGESMVRRKYAVEPSFPGWKTA